MRDEPTMTHLPTRLTSSQLPLPLSANPLTDYQLGQPQRAGALTMVPVFGPSHPGIASPRSGVKLSQVKGYGNVELTNSGGTAVALVPLHIGYIQDGAQNHALCRAGFLAPGQKLVFEDACCVQESQGGYLAERDQWFFILPLELRTQALALRGTKNYSKLWPTIARLNEHYGMPSRGHLEQLLSRKRAVLTQYQSRLELSAGQVGALFFIDSRLAGVEIAPNPRYLAEMWMALVCFAYGPAAWHASKPMSYGDLYDVSTLDGLRAALAADRRAVADSVVTSLAATDWQPAELIEEERFLDLCLSTVEGEEVGGQVVYDGDRLVYASLFSKSFAV